MAEKTLEELVEVFPNDGSELLKRLINKFADDGKVFTNESQFQFELGFRLQELFKEYEVRFEVLSLDDAKSAKIKKLYTDLVIEMPNGECIAIELKYKTALPNKKKGLLYSANNKETRVFAQGAYDIGCYDYWRDVYRLEQLVNREIKYNFSEQKKVVRGFAIIMSNDKNYWGEHKDGYYKNFYLTESNDAINSPRMWRNNGVDVKRIEDKVEKDKRFADYIEIKEGPYSLNWDEYILPKDTKCILFDDKKVDKTQANVYEDYKFRYLILEVK